MGKAPLRAEMAARRAALHAAQPLAGWTLAAHAPRLEGPRLDGPPGVVAGYWPMRSEIDPRPLMRRYAAAGWRLALPVTPARGAPGPLTFRLWSIDADLAARAFGMREPRPSAAAATPEVVLVPLLAVDGRGHRLGYGAGYYDRTLADLRAAGAVRAIGLAFSGQAVDALPADPHDQPLDALLTERGYVSFPRGPDRAKRKA